MWAVVFPNKITSWKNTLVSLESNMHFFVTFSVPTLRRKEETPYAPNETFIMFLENLSKQQVFLHQWPENYINLLKTMIEIQFTYLYAIFVFCYH